MSVYETAIENFASTEPVGYRVTAKSVFSDGKRPREDKILVSWKGNINIEGKQVSFNATFVGMKMVFSFFLLREV